MKYKIKLLDYEDLDLKPIKIDSNSSKRVLLNNFFNENYKYYENMFIIQLEEDLLETIYEYECDENFIELCDYLEKYILQVKVPKDIYNLKELTSWISNSKNIFKKKAVKNYTTGVLTGDYSLLEEDFDYSLSQMYKESRKRLINYLDNLIFYLNMTIPEIKWSYEETIMGNFYFSGETKENATEISIYLYAKFEDDKPEPKDIVYNAYNLDLDNNKYILYEGIKSITNSLIDIKIDWNNIKSIV